MTANWVTTGLSAVVILVASVVHGIAGFGFAQVSMGLMPLFRSPSNASIIFTATAVVSNARVWWSVRDAFDWRKWIVPVGGLVVGMLVGVLGGNLCIAWQSPPDEPVSSGQGFVTSIISVVR